MQKLLSTLLDEFREKLIEVKGSTPRLASFPDAKNLIKIAIGMRRVGKTYFCLQKVIALLKQGAPLESILYLNFEDDRLLPMNYKQMGALLDEFYSLYPENHTRECFIFLDEVQNVSEWARVVRRFLDTKKVQLYLTGSSAKLLSKEIATELRGRSLEQELWPFNFEEFLTSHAISYPKNRLGKKAFDLMRQHLITYFERGGFPAVQFLEPAERRQILQGYVESVILRDIVERRKVANITLLRYLINTLLKNVASPFSVNKFHKDIQSQGFTVSKDTLYSYLGYIEDSYLVSTVPLYSESVRERQTAQKKVYGIDSGLILANTFNLSENYGKFFENLIFLDLKRQGKELFYYKTQSNFEIDFVITSKTGRPQLLQVVWDMNQPETLERETRALEEAEKELGIKGSIIDLAKYLNEGLLL